jgi:hypothetical protein
MDLSNSIVQASTTINSTRHESWNTSGDIN